MFLKLRAGGADREGRRWGWHCWGKVAEAGKWKKASQDSEESNLEHKAFSLDIISSRKPTLTTKYKDDPSQNTWRAS